MRNGKAFEQSIEKELEKQLKKILKDPTKTVAFPRRYTQTDTEGCNRISGGLRSGYFNFAGIFTVESSAQALPGG